MRDHRIPEGATQRPGPGGVCRVTGQASALLLAACFTFGCAAIYEMRPWAQALTGILLRVVLCLVPVVAVVVPSRWPEAPSTPPGTRPVAARTEPDRSSEAQRPSCTGMLRSTSPASVSSAAGGAVNGLTPCTARSAR